MPPVEAPVSIGEVIPQPPNVEHTTQREQEVRAQSCQDRDQQEALRVSIQQASPQQLPVQTQQHPQEVQREYREPQALHSRSQSPVRGHQPQEGAGTYRQPEQLLGPRLQVKAWIEHMRMQQEVEAGETTAGCKRRAASGYHPCHPCSRCSDFRTVCGMEHGTQHTMAWVLACTSTVHTCEVVVLGNQPVEGCRCAW